MPLTAPGEETIHAKYDVLGAQIELRYPTGEVIRFNRDLLGRTTSLTSSVLGTSRYEYNGAVTVIDPWIAGCKLVCEIPRKR